MKKGYTLLELMFVIVIIAVLLGFGVTVYLGYIRDAEYASVKRTMDSVIMFEKTTKTKFDEFLYTYGSYELNNEFMNTWMENAAADPEYSKMGQMLILDIEPAVSQKWKLTVDRDGTPLNGDPWNCTGYILRAEKRTDPERFVEYAYLTGIWNENR